MDCITCKETVALCPVAVARMIECMKRRKVITKTISGRYVNGNGRLLQAGASR